MDFSQALDLLKKGKAVRRSGWYGCYSFVRLEEMDGEMYPRLHFSTGESIFLAPTWQWIMSEDWQLVIDL